jgi:hypothetical protein
MEGAEGQAGSPSNERCESRQKGIHVPRYAPNKTPLAAKRRYFELIRSCGVPEVGLSL